MVRNAELTPPLLFQTFSTRRVIAVWSTFVAAMLVGLYILTSNLWGDQTTFVLIPLGLSVFITSLNLLWRKSVPESWRTYLNLHDRNAMLVDSTRGTADWSIITNLLMVAVMVLRSFGLHSYPAAMSLIFVVAISSYFFRLWSKKADTQAFMRLVRYNFCDRPNAEVTPLCPSG